MFNIVSMIDKVPLTWWGMNRVFFLMFTTWAIVLVLWMVLFWFVIAPHVLDPFVDWLSDRRHLRRMGT